MLQEFSRFEFCYQVTRDVEALYGALQAACKRKVAKNILLKYEKTSNGVTVWQDLIEKFGNDGDKESRIANLEDVGQYPLHQGI